MNVHYPGRQILRQYTCDSVHSVQPCRFACKFSCPLEDSFHPQKVWCALSCTGIITPISFHKTVNTGDYPDIFQETLNQLDDQELAFGYFQHEAQCYTSNQALQEIKIFYGNQITSKDSWPPRSQDMILPCGVW
jgi:hypothetical protein